MLTHLLWVTDILLSANPIVVVPLIFVLAIIVYLAIPTQFIVNDGWLLISGLYGKTIDLRTVVWVEVTEELPSVTLRTKGYGFGYIKKGFFILEGLGRCRILLNGNYSPYLIIRTEHNEIIIINHKNKEYIHSLAQTIKHHQHRY